MKFTGVFFLLALAWQTASVPGRTASPKDLIAQMLPPETVLADAAAIGLTTVQRATLQRATAALQADVAALQQSMRKETGVLVEMLAQAKPDDAAVLAQYEKLNAIEHEVKRLRVTMTLRVKAVLTAEQQARVRARSAAPPGDPGDSATARGGIAGKLQSVKQGLERWKNEGRDVTRVRELWAQFQQAAEARRHADARRALDEALALLDASPAPVAATPPPQP